MPILPSRFTELNPAVKVLPIEKDPAISALDLRKLALCDQMPDCMRRSVQVLLRPPLRSSDACSPSLGHGEGVLQSFELLLPLADRLGSDFRSPSLGLVHFYISTLVLRSVHDLPHSGAEPFHRCRRCAIGPVSYSISLDGSVTHFQRLYPLSHQKAAQTKSLRTAGPEQNFSGNSRNVLPRASKRSDRVDKVESYERFREYFQ
jgi:hypothetical protein